MRTRNTASMTLFGMLCAYMYLPALIVASALSSVAPHTDDLREMVQHLENRVIQLTDTVDGLTKKQQTLSELIGAVAIENASPAVQSEFHRNLTGLVRGIETRFRRLLASLSAVSPNPEEAGMCTWSYGLTQGELRQDTGLFVDHIGTSRLSCTPDDDGWLTILRRVNGLVPFERSWEEYKHGFGDPDGSFWLGNELLHRLTSRRAYSLQVVLRNSAGEEINATYHIFRVASETQKYKLSVSGYIGTAGDSLSYHNNAKFSTIDQDNDESEDSCTTSNGLGGWWFKSCDYACLTGIYFSGDIKDQSGIEWHKAYDDHTSFKYAVMKIRFA